PGAFGDILISNEAPGLQNSNTIINNSLLSGISIFNNEPNGTTDPIHATCNWFGTTSPAAVAVKIANVSGGVTLYTPWLISGVDGDLVTIGFQPSVGCSFPCNLVVSVTTTKANCPAQTDGTATANIVS